jgi:hypothetical protein
MSVCTSARLNALVCVAGHDDTGAKFHRRLPWRAELSRRERDGLAASRPDSSGQAVNFINLPNGQVLAAAGSRDWIYTPVGSPQNSWRPTVTSVTANSNGSYHLTGSQLSGFVTTGEDDFQDPQNFPVVYLTNAAGNVYYTRSYNFSTMAPSTPGEAESADFTLPSGLPHGTYSLFVSACGISSATGYSFTY